MATEQTVDTAGWHLMLLGLAGRVSDSVLARCRGLLADQRPSDVRESLIGSVVAQAVPLFQSEVDFLGAADPAAAPDRRLAGVVVTETGVPLGCRFDQPGPANGLDQEDRVAIAQVARQAGARGLWRAWRRWTHGSASPRAARVFVVEADEDADLIATTGDLQRALGPAGRGAPRIEVYPTGFELPSYQRLARAHGDLVWAREPDPGVQVAVLFDEVDAPLGPRFRADHPRADGPERAALAAYLRRGSALLLTTGRLDDVVDRGRGRIVPISFRTDGHWVWSDATTYYLESHGLLPDPLLVNHIRARNHRNPAVDGVGMHRAMRALRPPAA